jgi:hypothetical protein
MHCIEAAEDPSIILAVTKSNHKLLSPTTTALKHHRLLPNPDNNHSQLETAVRIQSSTLRLLRIFIMNEMGRMLLEEKLSHPMGWRASIQ